MNECMNVYQSVWSQSAMSALGTVRHVASFVLAHSEKRSVNLQASSYKKFFKIFFDESYFLKLNIQFL